MHLIRTLGSIGTDQNLFAENASGKQNFVFFFPEAKMHACLDQKKLWNHIDTDDNSPKVHWNGPFVALSTVNNQISASSDGHFLQQLHSMFDSKACLICKIVCEIQDLFCRQLLRKRVIIVNL